MINVNPELVCSMIVRAREFHAKEAVVIPEQPLSPSDDWARQILADHADDPTYEELKLGIEDLEKEQQATLVALMWLGRGEFGIEEWESALSQARDSWTEHTADYLISTPLLASYLEEGLSLHGYSCGL